METEDALGVVSWKLHLGQMSDPSLEEGALWVRRGGRWGGGMAPVIVSYRCGAGTTGVASWGASNWAAVRATAGGPGRKAELWQPRVLAIWVGGFKEMRN